MVPQFGTGLTWDKLRIVFVFEDSTARKLIEIARDDTSGLRCIVVYLPGVLDAEQRRSIATLCRRHDLLLPVVDLAVFLELLTSPDSDRFERLMILTLPFTWVNPYVPHVAGRVPLEMFYGRTHEVQQLVSQTGPSFVYGGRQLGKSALLRRAQMQIEERESDAKGVYIDLNEHGIGLFKPPESLWAVVAEKLESVDIPVSKVGRSAFERVSDAVSSWLAEVPTRRLLILLDECDAFLELDFKVNYPVTHQVRGLMDRTNRRCKFVLAGLNLVQRFDRGTNHPMAHLAGSSIEVGPLDGRDAFKLVHEPLHALGIRFENDDFSLVYKILASTNDQASLIQLVCDRLLARIGKSSMGPSSSGSTITAELVEQELNDSELRSEISRRFEWTISLDGRYQAIAYRVALEARSGFPRHSPDDLLVLARSDWPDAFDRVSPEEFGWYLRELATFGVLRQANGEWMLRSPNLIELIGSPSDVEARLRRIATGVPESRIDPSRLRYPLDAQGTPGPLSGDQIARLVPGGEPCTVLVASELSGLGSVHSSLERLAADRGLQLTYRHPRTAAELPHRGRSAAKGEAWWIEVADLTELNGISAARMLVTALTELEALPDAAAARLFIVRPDQLSTTQLGDSAVAYLRSWDEVTLRRWFEIENRAVSDADLAEILRATGGWYSLLKPGLESAPSTSASFLASIEPHGFDVGSLCKVAGLSEVPGAASVISNLGGHQEWSEQELYELFADANPDLTLPALRRAGLLVSARAGFTLDPVACAVADASK